MADHAPLLELHKQHTAAQDRYTYFLLAAAGAAVGFAVQKTEGLKLSLWLLPVAAAMACWGVSFYFGCKNIVWVQSATAANYALLQLRAGVHPSQPADPQLLPSALSGTSKALGNNVAKAQFYGAWQFRLFILGAVCFIAWRLAEMVRFTYVP